MAWKSWKIFSDFISSLKMKWIMNNEYRMSNNMQKAIETPFQINWYELVDKSTRTKYRTTVYNECNQCVSDISQFHEYARALGKRVHTQPRQHMPIHYQWLHFWHRWKFTGFLFYWKEFLNFSFDSTLTSNQFEFEIFSN